MSSDVAVFVGSLRKDSFNRKMARALMELAPPSLRLEIVEIGHLPLYNQDTDANPPAAWTEFCQRVKAADADLLVTPEYNRSIPGALKNALDVSAADLFAADGTLTNDSTREFLRTFLEAFDRWIATISANVSAGAGAR